MADNDEIPEEDMVPEEIMDIEEPLANMSTKWAEEAQQLASSQLREATKLCESLRGQLQRERRKGEAERKGLLEKIKQMDVDAEEDHQHAAAEGLAATTLVEAALEKAKLEAEFAKMSEQLNRSLSEEKERREDLEKELQAAGENAQVMQSALDEALEVRQQLEREKETSHALMKEASETLEQERQQHKQSKAEWDSLSRSALNELFDLRKKCAALQLAEQQSQHFIQQMVQQQQAQQALLNNFQGDVASNGFNMQPYVSSPASTRAES